MKTIGAQIKLLREQKGYTQVELGEKIGSTGVTIMRYEKGQREPKLDIITKIAGVLGVTIADFFDSATITDMEEFSHLISPDDLKKQKAAKGYILQEDLDMRNANIITNAKEEANAVLAAAVADIPDSYLDKEIMDIVKRLNKLGKIALLDIISEWNYPYR